MRSIEDEDALELPVDRRGFLRKECGSCRRQFKLRHTEADTTLFLRRVSKGLPHANEHEIAIASAPRSCPYCGHRADADAWWTEEHRLCLSKIAASLSEEIRFEQLRYVERTLGQNPYLTFLPVAPAPFHSSMRAEPDDMRVVPLVCCGEEVKVRDTWTGSIHCPYCGIEHETEPPHSLAAIE